MASANNPIEPSHKYSTKSLPTFKKLSLIVGIIIILIIVFLAIIFYATASLVQVAQEQLASLRNGDTVRAYSFTSKDFQKATPIDEFKKFLDHYPSLKNNDHSSFIFRKFEGKGLAQIKGSLVAKDGAVTPVEYNFIKEDNSWKVLSIQVRPAGVAVKDNFALAHVNESAEKNLLTNAYKDSETTYSIRYPTHWSYEKRRNIVIFRGNKGGLSYYSTVNIQVVATKKNGGEFSTVSDFMDDLKNQFSQVSEDINIIEQGSIIITSKKSEKLLGEYLNVSYAFKKERIRQMQYVFMSNDGKYFYTFGYTAPESQYEVDLPIAKAMYKSWVIE